MSLSFKFHKDRRFCCRDIHKIVLTFNCQTPVPSPDFSLGLGVDFVLPLSQEEQEQEEEQEQPHQNIPKGNSLEVLNLAKSLTKPNP